MRKKNGMNKLFPKLAIAMIAFCLASPLHAADEAPTKPKAKHQRRLPVPRSLVGGLWRVDHTFVSTIQIKNIVKNETVEFTPALFMADGTEYVLPSQSLTPSQFVEINVNEALRNAPPSVLAHLSDSGSAVIRFTHSWNALDAAIQNLDTPRSLIFRQCFGQTVPANPKQPRDHAVEGLWWKRDADTSGFIGIANTTGAPVHLRVQPSSTSGVHGESRVLNLEAHSSTVLTLATLIAGTEAEHELEGGVRLEYKGALSNVVITGGMENPAQGFSAPMYFRVTGEALVAPAKHKVASVGIMIGKQDPMMGFPDKTTFSPYAVLRNTTEGTLVVQPELHYFIETKSQSMLLPTLTFSAGQAKRLDLISLMDASGIRNYNGNIHLSFEYQGDANDLVTATGSVDQTGTYVFDVPTRGLQPSASRSVSYYSEKAGFDTMFTLWNPGSEPEDLIITFDSQNGPYKLPVHVDAKGTAMFDLSEVVAQNKPDADGHYLPLGAVGTAEISSAQGRLKKFTIAVEAGTFNVQTATCEDESCNCGVYVQDLWIENDPFGMLVNSGVQLTATAWWTDSATTDVTSWYWSSDNTPVISLNYGGYANGVSPGSANAFYGRDFGTAPAEMCWLQVDCGRNDVEASAPGTAQVPTSLTFVSASILPSGSTGDYGCLPSADYGIMVDITYSVRDQNGDPILSSSMRPQEAGTFFTGGSYGPSDICGLTNRISSCQSPNTNFAGVFHDAPVGFCSTFPITPTTGLSATQNISILFNGHSYPVRTNNWTVTAPGSGSFGHGTLTNGSDITKSR